MAVTLSAATCVNPPRSNHEGVYSVQFKYELNGTTLSAGDTIVMGYIQPGHKVIDAVLWGTTADGPGTVKIGVASTLSAILTDSGVATTRVVMAKGPTEFSLSADAEGNLRIPILATAAGTSTVTGSINLILVMQAPVV